MSMKRQKVKNARYRAQYFKKRFLKTVTGLKIFIGLSKCYATQRNYENLLKSLVPTVQAVHAVNDRINSKKKTRVSSVCSNMSHIRRPQPAADYQAKKTRFPFL
jgi:hypothetical protein